MDAEDLRLIDAHAFRALRQLAGENLPGGIGGEPTVLVEELAEYFEVSLSDGTVVPVCCGGQDRVLSYENRVEYAELAMQTRLQEGRVQVHAIRSGLSSLVPAALLNLLDWRELEAIVTGQPEIDLALLREHTIWRSGEDIAVIDYLWEVVALCC